MAQRPQLAIERGRIGDWEGDKVVGMNSRNCLVTLVDLTVGCLISGRAQGRTAARVTDRSIRLMGSLAESSLHTLTLDNGDGFAPHAQLAKSLEIGVYFARPFRSLKRRGSETTNRPLRQFVANQTDISMVSPHRPVRRSPKRRPSKTSQLSLFNRGVQ